jgi:raffinose/stachyose/melibiose transport system substrate-binding protein
MRQEQTHRPEARRGVAGRLRAALLAAATAVAAAGAGVAAQAGEIDFWTWRVEDRTQYERMFREFEQAHPGVTVKFNAFEVTTYQTTLSAALAAGRGPDVIHLRAYGGQEQFSRAGYLLALDPAQVPELANFTEAALGSMTLRSDGRVYGVPFASQTLGILYNREIFQRLGVEPPATWQDMIALCGRLKQQGIVPLANGFGTGWMGEVFTSVFTASALGNGFVQDILAGRATFEDPRYVGALARMLELRDCMPPGFAGVDYPTMQQLFLTGRAAMFAGGSFEIANFRRQNPNLQLGFAAPPAAEPGGPRLVSLFYDGGYAVNARTDNMEDSLKLLRWLARPEFGNRFTELLANISPIRGVRIEDPLLAEIARLNERSMDYIMAVHFRYNDPTGSTILQSAVQRMMAGTIQPADVGAELTQGIRTYFQPFQR